MLFYQDKQQNSTNTQQQQRISILKKCCKYGQVEHGQDLQQQAVELGALAEGGILLPTEKADRGVKSIPAGHEVRHRLRVPYLPVPLPFKLVCLGFFVPD